MLFFESGRVPTTFVRILRFYYRVTGGQPVAPNKPLTYRTFQPHLIGPGRWGVGEYESLPQTMSRAQAWFNKTGA